jgi:LAS superfamily LD-carboxypeptidase LdcB
VPFVTVEFPSVCRLDCTVTEQVGYRKGRKFPISVVSIDGRMVELQTATAYWAMQEAAAADGVELPIYSAFRTLDDQEYFYNCYKTCSCNSCVRAARPGYSNHQSGRAIDFGQWDGAIDWLRENGRTHRFYNTIRKEPWHWEYRPKRKRGRKRNRKSATGAALCPVVGD